MSVLNITDSAIKELQKVKEGSDDFEGNVVRVSIKGGGCSGFSYELFFDSADNVDKGKDIVMEEGGLTFVVDKKSALYIEGTILNWYEDLNRRGFSFENPNATKSCGCGSSFSV